METKQAPPKTRLAVIWTDAVMMCARHKRPIRWQRLHDAVMFELFRALYPKVSLTAINQDKALNHTFIWFCRQLEKAGYSLSDFHDEVMTVRTELQRRALIASLN